MAVELILLSNVASLMRNMFAAYFEGSMFVGSCHSVLARDVRVLQNGNVIVSSRHGPHC